MNNNELDQNSLQKFQDAPIANVINYITDMRFPDTRDFTSVHFIICDRVKDNRQ